VGEGVRVGRSALKAFRYIESDGCGLGVALWSAARVRERTPHAPGRAAAHPRAARIRCQAGCAIAPDPRTHRQAVPDASPFILNLPGLARAGMR
jgi:hypothetical protein